MNILKKHIKKIKENIQLQSDRAKSNAVVVFNLVLIAFQFGYILLRLQYVNDQIPFWFTQSWGDAMLGDKNLLFLLPSAGLAILLTGILFEFLFRKYFVRYLREVILVFVTLANILFSYSLVRIIFVASSPFPPLVSPLVFSLLIPFVVAFAATQILLPYFISFAAKNDIVTNPKLHQHPGMVLQKPSARGGGAFYAAVFIILSILFVGLPFKLMGFFVAVLMLGLLGFVDDYQNTHPKSPFKTIENPSLRLLLMFSAVAVVVLSGVVIKTVGNPFGGYLDLTQFSFKFDDSYIVAIAYLFTSLWIAWVLNLLSWSNGIDGQYGGIVGITSIFLCILALRFTPLALIHKQVAIMAAISAGVAFGFTKHAWYPSSIMWGFGATAAGIVIAGLSILINTKIIVSILILLIPFLDATVTFTRRLLQKKSPLKGDRGHFHHLLLDMGWSVPQIARFYWVTTFVFGVIGLLSSDRFLVQTVLIIGGIVAFVIVLTNLRSIKKPILTPQTE
jgi:UDP-GlcNAc:undecaprenyl-phosphate GlcNAc-1-phosphate transferase